VSGISNTGFRERGASLPAVADGEFGTRAETDLQCRPLLHLSFFLRLGGEGREREQPIISSSDALGVLRLEFGASGRQRPKRIASRAKTVAPFRRGLASRCKCASRSNSSLDAPRLQVIA
jgi:hypothetical protein